MRVKTARAGFALYRSPTPGNCERQVRRRMVVVVVVVVVRRRRMMVSEGKF